MKPRSLLSISFTVILFIFAVLLAYFDLSCWNKTYSRLSSAADVSGTEEHTSSHSAIQHRQPNNSSPNREAPAESESSSASASITPCNITQPSPPYPLQPPDNPNLPQLVLDYIAFHKKARTCLLDPECTTKPPILVANCRRNERCLGLGDRMRGIDFAFTIALITKRVFFLHELGSPYPLEAGFAPSAIDWTLPSTVSYNHSWPYLEWFFCREGKPCHEEDQPLSSLSNFNGQGPDINMFTDDVVGLFTDKPVVSLACRITFGGVKYLERNPFLKHTYEQLGRGIRERKINIYRLMFQPSQATKRVLQTFEDLGDYLSVHIRTGIDTKETDLDRFAYFVSHEEEVVDKALECLTNVRLAKNISNIFLASDSTNTKELFKRKGKQMAFNVRLLDTAAVHISRKWSYGSLTQQGLCASYISVFADIFMLARAKVILRTGSNLSMFSSYLGGNPSILMLNDNRTLEKWCQF